MGKEHTSPEDAIAQMHVATYAASVERKNALVTKQVRYDGMYMSLAEKISEMSHDRDTKVAGVLVKDDNIISFGWNGMPPGFPNECKGQDGRTLPEVCHAEENVIAKLAKCGGPGARGATLYTTLSPCFPCARLLLQSGVSRVVYRDECKDPGPIEFLRRGGVACESLRSEM